MASLLVVEDDDNIAALLQFMLGREGHAVEVLRDGGAAQQRLEAGPACDLVVLDAMLPLVDGVSLLRLARSLPAWRSVPVVMLTARTLERDIVAALEAGASDYVVKPFQPQELIARVRRLLATRPAA